MATIIWLQKINGPRAYTSRNQQKNKNLKIDWR